MKHTGWQGKHLLLLKMGRAKHQPDGKYLPRMKFCYTHKTYNMDNINIELSPFEATALIAFCRANKNKMGELAGLSNAAQAFENAVRWRINIEQLEDASAEMRVNQALSELSITKS